MQVADKTVVIAGLGVSGTSLAEVLRERGAHVIGVDERKPEADLHSFDDVDWDHVDYVMSSPVFNPRTPFVQTVLQMQSYKCPSVTLPIIF